MVGEISAMYKGTAKEETPIAIPRKKRANTSIIALDEAPDHTAPIEKMIADARITFFRPTISAILPLNIAPITAPTSPAVVIISIQLSAIANVF